MLTEDNVFLVLSQKPYHENWLLLQQKASIVLDFAFCILHFAFCILNLPAKPQYTPLQSKNAPEGAFF